MKTVAEETRDLLRALGVQPDAYETGDYVVRTPITGEIIGRVHTSSNTQSAVAIQTAHQAFLAWRKMPAPKRGELLRLLGE